MDKPKPPPAHLPERLRLARAVQRTRAFLEKTEEDTNRFTLYVYEILAVTRKPQGRIHTTTPPSLVVSRGSLSRFLLGGNRL